MAIQIWAVLCPISIGTTMDLLFCLSEGPDRNLLEKKRKFYLKNSKVLTTTRFFWKVKKSIVDLSRLSSCNMTHSEIWAFSFCSGMEGQWEKREQHCVWSGLLTGYKSHGTKSQQRSTEDRASRSTQCLTDSGWAYPSGSLSHLPGDWRLLRVYRPGREDAQLHSWVRRVLRSGFSSQDERESRRFWGRKAALRGLSDVCVQVTAV